MVTDLLADDARRDLLARNVAKMALRDSDERIVDMIEKVLETRD